MLSIKDSIILIIDVQEKLVKAANNGEECAIAVEKLAKAANILNIPIIVTEQYPEGLGSTVIGVKQALPTEAAIIEKNSFSAVSEEKIATKLNDFNHKQVIICGIEAHICVLQTAINLLKSGYQVHIVKDAVASRNIENLNIGLDLLKHYGAKISCLEIVLFEWLKTSKHPHFKEIQALIK